MNPNGGRRGAGPRQSHGGSGDGHSPGQPRHHGRGRAYGGSMSNQATHSPHSTYGGPSEGGPSEGGPSEGGLNQVSPAQGGSTHGRYQGSPYQGSPHLGGPFQRGTPQGGAHAQGAPYHGAGSHQREGNHQREGSQGRAPGTFVERKFGAAPAPLTRSQQMLDSGAQCFVPNATFASAGAVVGSGYIGTRFADNPAKHPSTSLRNQAHHPVHPAPWQGQQPSNAYQPQPHSQTHAHAQPQGTWGGHNASYGNNGPHQHGAQRRSSHSPSHPRSHHHSRHQQNHNQNQYQTQHQNQNTQYRNAGNEYGQPPPPGPPAHQSQYGGRGGYHGPNQNLNGRPMQHQPQQARVNFADPMGTQLNYNGRGGHGGQGGGYYGRGGRGGGGGGYPDYNDRSSGAGGGRGNYRGDSGPPYGQGHGQGGFNQGGYGQGGYGQGGYGQGGYERRDEGYGGGAQFQVDLTPRLLIEEGFRPKRAEDDLVAALSEPEDFESQSQFARKQAFIDWYIKDKFGYEDRELFLKEKADELSQLLAAANVFFNVTYLGATYHSTLMDPVNRFNSLNSTFQCSPSTRNNGQKPAGAKHAGAKPPAAKNAGAKNAGAKSPAKGQPPSKKSLPGKTSSSSSGRASPSKASPTQGGPSSASNPMADSQAGRTSPHKGSPRRRSPVKNPSPEIV